MSTQTSEPPSTPQRVRECTTIPLAPLRFRPEQIMYVIEGRVQRVLFEEDEPQETIPNRQNVLQELSNHIYDIRQDINDQRYLQIMNLIGQIHNDN